MRSLVLSLWLTGVLFLAGCASAPQVPVSLAPDFFTAKPGKVGVVISEMPKPDTFFPGAGCLICLATASMANSSLTTHVKTLNTDELKPLQAELAKLLTAQGLEVVIIDTPLKMDSLPDRANATPNQARKDFASLRDKHKIDRLLVVDIKAVGFTRSYSAYVPTGAPNAMLQGSAYMVQLSSGNLDWLEPINTLRGTDGAWDESPKFPGLTNAYYQVLEMGMEQIKKPFVKR
jgi:hypothetical protein